MNIPTAFTNLGAALLLALLSQVKAQTAINYVGPGGGTWSNPLNWSGGTVPNNTASTGYIAFIDGGNTSANTAVNLNQNAALSGAKIDAGDQLTVPVSLELGATPDPAATEINGRILLTGNGSLGLRSDGAFQNNGLIELQDDASAKAIQILSGTVQLQGNGRISMHDTVLHSIYGDGSPSSQLINGLGHTIEGVGTIGFSPVLGFFDSVGIVNHGTINANASGALVIDPSDLGLINDGTLRASDGGTLSLQNGSVNNTGGLITATSGSKVKLKNVAIAGGTVRVPNNATLEVDVFGYGDLSDSNITLDNQLGGKVAITGNGILVIGAGNYHNDGQILLQSDGSAKSIRVRGDAATLSGTGMLSMTDSYSVIMGDGGATDRLINGLGHTIEGVGTLGNNSLGIINHGTINANASGALVIDPSDALPVINQSTGIFRGTGTAGLQLTGGTFDNQGTVEALNGSSVTYSTSANTSNNLSGVLTGGKWRSVATGGGATITLRGNPIQEIASGTDVELNGAGSVIQVGSTTIDSTLTTNRGSFSIRNGRNFTAAGTFNNNGSVDVQQGTLQLGAGGVHTGSFSIASGATIRLQGTHDFASSSAVSGVGTLWVFNGTTDFAGQLATEGIVTARGTLNVNSATSGKTLNLTGSLSGSGNVTFQTVNWDTGGMFGTGTTVIAAEGTLTSNDSGSVQLYRTLVNEGSALFTRTSINFGNGTIQNNGDFSVYADGTQSFAPQANFTTNSFKNAGTFTKLGTGTTRFIDATVGSTFPFNNSGAADVQGGTLQLSSGVTQHVGTQLTGGVWHVHDNAAIDFATGSNITTNFADVTLDGPNSTFGKINTLVDNRGNFAVREGHNFNAGGMFSNTGFVEVAAGSTFTAPALTQHVGSVLTGGTWHIGGTLSITAGANITTNQGNVRLDGPASTFDKINSLVDNQGVFAILNGRNFDASAGPFSNMGAVLVGTGSTLHLSSLNQINAGQLMGGSWYIGPNGTLQIDIGTDITTNLTAVTLDGSGSTFSKIDSLVNNYGTLELLSGRNFSAQSTFHNYGTLAIAAGSTLTAASGLTQHAGAVLKGTGTLAGNLSNSGKLAPGNSPGIFQIDGDYTQTATGELETEIGGLAPGTQHDQVVVSGAASLAGRLEVSIVSVSGYPAYAPQLNDEITFLTAAGGISGKFDSLSAPNLSSVSNLAIKVFKSIDQKEVHLKFVAPSNVLFTDTQNADWQNNISWSSSNVPDSDNIAIVHNNAIGGDQRVDVQSANAYTDQLMVNDPDAHIIVGVKNGNTLSAAIGGVTIGQNAAIELGDGTSGNVGTLTAPSSKTVTIQDGGTLKGNGTVMAGELTIADGIVAPGFSVGHIDVTGNYNQQPSGTLLVDVSGTDGSQHDTIDVTGQAQLGGTIQVNATGFVLTNPGQPIPILSAGSRNGVFDDVLTSGNPNIYFAPIYGTPGSGAGAPGSGASVDCGVATCIAGYLKGDMDRDGNEFLDAEDVQVFALALNNPTLYKLTYGISRNQPGDLDGDSLMTFDDIRHFKDLMSGSGMGSAQFDAVFNAAMATVPEPSSAAFLIVGGVCMFVRRRFRPRGFTSRSRYALRNTRCMREAA